MKEKEIKIYQRGEKVLREEPKEVPLKDIETGRIQNIINKMEKSIAENSDAIAVAAPQIGESLRIFVISEWVLNPKEDSDKNEFKNLVFINPRITNMSKTKVDYPEGCLSAPGVFGTVKRAEKVKVEAYDRDGKKFSRGASGLLAQTVQHELDHLNGILFVDKKND
jgi:peptide deformylase